MDTRKILAITWMIIFVGSIIVPLVKIDGNGSEETLSAKKGYKETSEEEITSSMEGQQVNGEGLITEDSSLTGGSKNQREGEKGDSINLGTIRDKGAYEYTSDATYNVNETFTGYNTLSLDTSDTIDTSTTNQDIITINNITNYDKKQGKFSISSITATEDWNKAEDAYDGLFTSAAGSDQYQKMAQEILISSRVNLTKIRVRIGWYYAGGLDKPKGFLFLVNDVTGSPGSTNISSQINLTNVYNLDFDNDVAGNTQILQFSSPVTLTAGSYWLMLNDTTDQSGNPGYWRWATHTNTVPNPSYAKCYGFHYTDQTWYNNARDYYLSFETLEVDTGNDALTYSNPSDVSLEYNSTPISTNSFSMLLNEGHNFTTDISVLISGTWECNFTAQNLITASSNFSVNSTDTQWNVTATNNAITGANFNIEDHLLNLTGLPANWDDSKGGVYNGTSTIKYTNFKYTSGSDYLELNITSDTAQSEWHFVFHSDNYISYLMVNGTSVFPYATNETVTLNVSTVFNGDVSGTNKSLVVYDPNDVINHTEKDFDAATHFYWDISETLTKTVEVNGTYTVEVWWNNDTHAGFSSAEVDLEVTTNLTTVPVDFDEKLINTLLNVTAQFNSTFNETGLQRATVKYSTTWGPQGSLTEQFERGNYTVEGITTDGAASSPGNHELTINASLDGYLYQEVVIPVKLVNNATIKLSIANAAVNYTDNNVVYINFTENDGTPITGADIKVNDTVVSTTYSSNLYEWIYDSDNEGFLGSVYLDIEANKSGFKTRNESITLTVEANPTTIHGSGYREAESQSSIANKSIVPLNYNDSFILEVKYEDLNHSLTVDTYLDNITIQTTLNYTLVENLANNNWTITFDINNTDDQTVNVTFSFFGYDTCLFMVNLTIIEAATTTTGQASGTVEVYFNEYYEFTITYTDTIHTEDIINATVIISGLCDFIYEGNTTGIYSFNFTNSLTSMVNQSVTIYFSKTGYVQQQVDIYFGMLARTTELTHEGGYANESIFLIYWNNDYSFTLNWTDTVNDTRIQVTSWQNEDPNVNYDGDYYNYTFNGDKSLQTWIITINFSAYGYENKSWTFSFNIEARPTVFGADNTYLNASTVDNFNYSDYLAFYVEWIDVNTSSQIEDITFPTITGNGSIYVVYIGYVGGRHNFTLSADDLGTYEINITFDLANHVTARYHLIIVVNEAHTAIVGQLYPYGFTKNIARDFVLEFWVIWNDTDHDVPLDGTAGITLLANSTPATNELAFIGYTVLGNHSFTFNTTTSGTYNITIVFKIDNYTSSRYTFWIGVDLSRTFISWSGGSEKGDSGTAGEVIVVVTVYNRQFGSTYNFWIYWNSSDDGTPLNDALLEYVNWDGTFLSTSAPSNGYHNFTFTASDMAGYTVTIRFQIPDYVAIGFRITFNVIEAPTELRDYLIPPDGQYPDDIYYGDDLAFSIAWFDLVTQTNITAIVPAIVPQPPNYPNVTFDGIIDGRYTFTLHANNVRILSGQILSLAVRIEFNDPRYADKAYTVTFILKPSPTAFDAAKTTVPSGETVDTLYYTDVFEFNVTWYDTQHIQYLDVTGIASAMSGSATVYITAESLGNGVHSFQFDATAIGTFALTITFSLDNYTNAIYTLTFTVNPNPTARVGGEYPPGTVFNYTYSDEVMFVLSWQDQQHSIPVTGVMPKWNMTTDMFNFTGEVNGDYYFRFTALIVGSYSVNITMSLYGYETRFYIIAFSISPIITELPVATTNTTALPDKILSGRDIITEYSWMNTTSQEPVTNAIVRLEINGTFYDDLITVNETQGTGIYQLLIKTGTIPKGYKEFVLHFEIYGYINQSITAELLIIGHTINIIFRIPDNITQGEPFEIGARLIYNDPVEGARSMLAINYRAVYFNQFYSGITSSQIIGGYGFSYRLASINQDGVPVPGEGVSFEVVLEHENGTLMTFNQTVLSKSDGWAEFVVDATATQDAVKVIRIAAAYSGSDFNDPITLDYSIPGGFIEITKRLTAADLINLLIQYSPFIIALLALLAISGFLFYRRNQRIKAIKKVRAAATRRILDISSINKVFCRHVDGITVYNEDLYGESSDTDAIAGMSTAISAFIDDVAGKSTVTKGIERMERGKFAMLSYHGKKSTVTIISTGKVSGFLEKSLKDITQELEEIFAKELEKFYSSDQVPAGRVKEIVRKHIPLGLLDAMTANREKYKEVVKDVAKEQKTVLKELLYLESDLPAPFPVFFLGSIQRQLKPRHDTDLVNECIEKAFLSGLLLNLTDKQVADIGRAFKEAPEPVPEPVPEPKKKKDKKKRKKELPAAPKKEQVPAKSEPPARKEERKATVKGERKLPAPPRKKK